jgi:hypothetical protein
LFGKWMYASSPHVPANAIQGGVDAVTRTRRGRIVGPAAAWSTGATPYALMTEITCGLKHRAWIGKRPARKKFECEPRPT